MNKFWLFVCSLLVFFNATIFIRSQPQIICLTGDEAKKYNDRLIEEHNKNRSCHGVPPLVSDDVLMQDSIEWSKQMAIKRVMEHSPKNESKYGENLAYMYPVSEGSNWNPVESWYAEIKDYQGIYSSATGHFSQVVWKASQKVGCGMCSNPIEAYTTCRYSPPGNYPGQFEENVPPRKINCEGGGNTTEAPGNPTSSNKYTENTSSPDKTTTAHPNATVDMEETLVFITISTQVILGSMVLIILSVLVYYYAISYYNL